MNREVVGREREGRGGGGGTAQERVRVSNYALKVFICIEKGGLRIEFFEYNIQKQ